MIPILYEATETAFTTNGKGRLTDIISATVTEERNGIYELEFVYPVNGKLYDELLNGGIVACWHDDTHTVQPFDLYKHTAPLDGKVTFNARHIRYRQANIILKPFTGSSCSDTMSKIVTNSANTNPFVYSTDKAVTAPFTLDRPRSVQSLLIGEEGSILDVYGKGDFEFDRFNVILHANRGTDSGVTIRYGKNLADLTDDYSEDGVFTAVAPYWTGNDTVVYPPEVIVTSPNAPAAVVPVALDLSGSFQDKPTAAQLRTEAQRQLNEAEPWLPTRNIKIDFVALWQTTEYANVAVLERLALCDTVSVIYDDLGVNVKQKVIKVVYDVLSERYSEMELGATSETLGEAITQSLDKRLKQMASISFLRDAVADATAQITGGLGGYVVLKLNAAGQPEELLIMDTPDTSTAVNVWRFNQGGLGHSHSGYNGPFNDIALTQDGKINANMITVGTLDGDIVRVRNLTVVDENDNVLATYDANGIVLGQDGEVHAEMDFNSFELLDRLGNPFFFAGALNGSDGLASVTETKTGGVGGSNLVYDLAFTISEVVSVSTPTETLPSSAYTVDSFVYIPIDNDYGIDTSTEVTISYKTEEQVYQLTAGSRAQGKAMGPWSCSIGRLNAASGIESAVFGGYNNTAGDHRAFVGGGESGEAWNVASSVVGGVSNKTYQAASSIMGGNGNTIGEKGAANGRSCVIIGGDQNTVGALPSKSVIIGGSENEIGFTANNAVVLGGIGNKAVAQSQVIFGEYNVRSYGIPTYRSGKLEIVGNGTADSARSNARTLDWNGNEWLAGSLTIEGNRDIGAELDGMKFRDVTPTTADLLETLCPWEATGKLSLYLVTGGLISDAPLTNTATAYVACIGYSAAHHIHVLMYTSNPNIGGRTFIRQTRNSNPLAWREVVTSNTSAFYGANDTVSIGKLVWPGMVTGSTRSLYLNVSVDKSLEYISTVTVTGLTGTMRGPSGYVDNSGDKDWTSGEYSVTATKVTNHQIQINITKSSAFSGVTNNVAVSYWGTIGLKFT